MCETAFDTQLKTALFLDPGLLVLLLPEFKLQVLFSNALSDVISYFYFAEKKIKNVKCKHVDLPLSDDPAAGFRK